MDFYSHLEKRDGEIILEKSTLLKNHLIEVGNKAKNFLFFNSLDHLREVAYYLGVTHDIGKYTTYFQDRLFERKEWGKLADHGFISSLYSAFFFQKIVEKLNIGEKIFNLLPLISFFIIFHHHLDLTSLSHLEERLEKEEYLEIVKQQLENLKLNSVYINKDLKDLGLPSIEEFGNNLESLIFLLKKQKYNFENKLKQEEKEKIAIVILSLFSALIDADKKSAGKIQEIERRKIPSNIVEVYKNRKFSKTNYSEIDSLREEIFEKVINKIPNLDLFSEKIFTFTAPTGSGKTLAGFAFAAKLREKIEKCFGYSPRIIYSLPFISIINQNYEILYEVLSNIENFEGNSSAYIIGHHHLTNIEYEEGDEMKEIDTALYLIESWESEVIVTTFVQLFHTILGFKNNLLKKYHNIARSIILLDEVQNIPAEYWVIIRRILNLMVRYLGCYVILMTATKPLIFSEEEATEILENNEKYFKILNRVTLKSKIKESKNVDEFADWFKNNYDERKSYLIVLNTINSSIDVYNKLKKLNIPNIYYLSANLIHKDKLERIKRIKEELNENKKPVLVSTQVVEAGVDVDFDVTIRDIGPIDSIIQVAGRCNRNFKKDKGEVLIFFLKDEHEKSYASYVYLKILPLISREILEEIEEIKESDFLRLVNEYFVKLKEVKSFEKSEELYNALISLRFFEKNEKSVSDFKIIEKKGLIYPVFIEKDKEAKEIWKEFTEIINNPSLDRWEKKKELLRIKRKFEDYIVNVRVREKDTNVFNLIFEKDLGYIPYEKKMNFTIQRQVSKRT